MAQKWYYSQDGTNRIGPVSDADLLALAKAGMLTPAHLVLKEGASNWSSASKVKGLFPPLPTERPAPPASPSASRAVRPKVTPVASPHQGQLQNQSKSGTRFPKQIVIIIAAVGMSLFTCCGCGVLLSYFGTFQSGVDFKGSDSGTTRQENNRGHAGQATHAKGRIKIVHTPYTQVTMQAIPASLTHDIDWNTKPNTQNNHSKPKPFEPVAPVMVADISLVDFLRGPNGESIEMDRYSYGSELAQKGYFYRNKQGEVVNHGPWTTYQNGKKKTEFIYIHGVVKASFTSYGNEPECLEVYLGDGKHTKEYRGYHENGAIRVVERYLLQHHHVDGKELIKAIPHGLFEDYYDNTVVQRAKLHDQMGGLKKLELFENGQSVGVRVLDRQGNIAVERGRLTPKKE